MKFWKFIYLTLVLIVSMMAIAILQIPDQNLHIVACNVGQGDAILVIYGNTQILTDGGPDKSVLTCLGRYLPFWDKKIELVVSTHPDSDHATGLVSVLQSYKVENIIINSIDPGTQVYKALVSEVGGGGVTVINPNMGISLGVGLIRLDILSPMNGFLDRLTVENVGDNLTGYSISKDTNLYSVVYKLSFKQFSALFSGDMPPEVSDRLSTDSGIGDVDYIKIPHHGSVNGITEKLIKAIVPKIAVISVGKNPWSFPRQEVLDILAKYNVNVLRTDQKGDIELVTDGEKYWIK